MRLRLACLIGSCALVATLSGCGTPGSPQPPSLNLASPVEDLTASRRGNKVDLEWTLPTKNTDHTNIKRNPLSRICRSEDMTLAAQCHAVAEVQPPTEKPEPKEKGQPPPARLRIHYVDTLPAQLGAANPAGSAMYAVEEVNARGRSAGLSNQVAIPLVPVIAAPEKLSAEVSGDGVRISWSGAAPPQPPPGVTYVYRVLRSPAGTTAYITLGDVPPAASGTYVDKTSAWEQKYDYRITTLSEVKSGDSQHAVEGEDSVPVEVFTRDTYPPAQPGGLQAVFSSVGQKPFIDLSWAPNVEPDLGGYNVFRWSEGQKPERLNAKLVLTPSYRDEAVEAGVTYTYAVSAVDLRGNESPRSETASESVH